jgi:peptidoglycan/LPS O-acetylase OafA/YrhL
VDDRAKIGGRGPLAHQILSLISRRTTTGAFVPEMDGLRFVAILWVVVYHVKSLHDPADGLPMRVLAGAGHYGVHLFFVISGFVLALPFASWRMKQGKSVSLKRYYLRRVTRLEPPYLLSLFIYFSLKVLVKGANLSELVEHLLASSTYTHNLIYGVRSTISVVAWSLEVEVQFYLLAPLLGRLFSIEAARTRRLVFLAMAMVSMGFAAITSQHDHPRLFLSLPMYLQYFLIGFLFADLYLSNDWRSSHGTSRAWDVVGVAAFALLSVVIYFFYKRWIGQLVGPLLCAAFVFAAFHGRLSNRFFRNPWIYSIGGMCYTIYLYHSLVMHFVGGAIERLPLGSSYALRAALELFASIIMVGLVCPLIFVTTERPFMQPDWPQRFKDSFTTRLRMLIAQ